MLQQGKTPDEAMGAAQRKLWQDGRSLNEWAAFTVHAGGMAVNLQLKIVIHA